MRLWGTTFNVTLNLEVTTVGWNISDEQKIFAKQIVSQQNRRRGEKKQFATFPKLRTIFFFAFRPQLAFRQKICRQQLTLIVAQLFILAKAKQSD